ncbi:M20/M25/M40 family metallo-hydrolase [Streptomyces sp. NPDC004031]
MSVFGAADRDLLLDLLALPTAGPLEGGPGAPAPALWEAQRRYAQAAAGLGFAVVHHAAPPPGCLARADVPLPVREAAAARPDFLDCQPGLVLALGPTAAPAGRTVMFNVHLDTVAGAGPVSFDGVRFHGRGAIDAKGPAVALLAGLRQALREQPGLPRDTRVLVQAVSGEEGGALGTFGTRPLVEAGHHGRLNVFCEPTGGRALLRCTAAMTARIRVHGRDAIDDRPGAGHNATVLLGHLAAHLAAALDPRLDPAEGQVCVAGLHTGTLHNRVYGEGQLLLNLSYGSAAAGQRLERLVSAAVAGGLRSFRAEFAASPRFGRTAADAADIVRLDWLKRGLPALDGDPSWLAPLLHRAGVPLWPAAEPGFTCDAIWMSGVPGAHTVVLGPGRLDTNRAHADGEFAELTELDAFAATVPRLLAAFRSAPADDVPRVPPPARPAPSPARTAPPP